MAYWLMKSEPTKYGWDDLVRDGGDRLGRRPQQCRAAAPAGDEARRRGLFLPFDGGRAIVGIMRIAGPQKPDGEDGSWVKVPVEPVRPLPRPVTLAEIKAEPKLAKMELIRQSRLSVAPVRDEEWELILEMTR